MSLKSVKYFIAGGLGFIGSNLVHRILECEPNCQIIVYDNLSSGRLEFLTDVIPDPRLSIIIGDIEDSESLITAMKNCDIVYHLASNADISKAITEPSIDFWKGTYLTHCILEAMRINGVSTIIYASGSGVYGDGGDTVMNEEYSPMQPISTYGASKLAGEALISAYSHMFDINAIVFRFANVVGPCATHGVIFDLIRKLRSDPTKLEILGSGNQAKSYIYVDDILDAIYGYKDIIIYNMQTRYQCYNVATKDIIIVKAIANAVISKMKLENVEIIYGKEDVGWKGDIKLVLLDSTKIRELGWNNKYTTFMAISKTIDELLKLE